MPAQTQPITDVTESVAPVFGADVECRQIAGFPLYRVGIDGSVWSCLEKGRWGRIVSWRRLQTPPNNHGYLQVNMRGVAKKQHFKVHNLVLLAFVGPKPAGLCVRHLNGDRADNRLQNLCYGTYQENSNDAIRHGRTNRGRRCWAAKLREDQVVAIRQRVAAGEKQKDLASEYSVCKATICEVVSGKAWGHVVGGLPSE